MRKLLFFVISLCLITVSVACNENIDNRYGGHGLSLQRQDMEHGPLNLQDDISSDQTDIPSYEFPHTQPIQVQEAEFDFEVNPDQLHPETIYDLDLDLLPDLGELLSPDESASDGEAPTVPDQAEEDRQQQENRPPASEQPEQESRETQREDQETEQADVAGIRQEEQRVIELTNQHRVENGLSELQADEELTGVARKKSTDMQQNNYFSHTSPTYGSPFDMIRDFRISYSSAGENIAQGQQTPEQVVQAWMDSPGHRENILNGTYTHIGVGYDPNGNHWTQLFISR